MPREIWPQGAGQFPIGSNFVPIATKMEHVAIRSQNDRLKELLLESWSAYDRLHDQDFVVRPAIPILFFGDSDRYFSSPIRVVTVGLNPSNNEFPDGSRLSRFPAARKMAVDSDQRELSQHLGALNAYFRTDPLKSWFASFEPILHGLAASYYDGQPSTVLHTDLCSPIATAPPWSGLAQDQRSLLMVDGVTLWHSLVETLAPDVIVISIARRHLEQITFAAAGPLQVIWTLDRENPFQVLGTFLTIGSAQPSLLVFGQAKQKPFGSVPNVSKPMIGAAVRELYNASRR